MSDVHELMVAAEDEMAPDPVGPARDADGVVAWQVGEDRVEIDLLSVDACEWRDARAATGLGSTLLVHAALVLRELDAIAALIWIARHRATPDLTYEDVARSLSLAAMEP